MRNGRAKAALRRHAAWSGLATSVQAWKPPRQGYRSPRTGQRATTPAFPCSQKVACFAYARIPWRSAPEASTRISFLRKDLSRRGGVPLLVFSGRKVVYGTHGPSRGGEDERCRAARELATLKNEDIPFCLRRTRRPRDRFARLHRADHERRRRHPHSARDHHGRRDLPPPARRGLSAQGRRLVLSRDRGLQMRDHVVRSLQAEQHPEHQGQRRRSCED
jgi:hypothetical protein